MINTVAVSSNFRFKYVAPLSALILVIIILVFANLPDTRLFWRELQNSPHTLIFATVVILILTLLRKIPQFFCRTPFKFYIVADLSANWTRPFLRLNNAVISSDVNNGIRVEAENHFTRVPFMREAYPGFSIIETTSDWSAYSTFRLAIYSKMIQPFELVLRVHDAQHTYSYRFNIVLTINKGINYFNIPLEAIKKPLQTEKLTCQK